MILWFDEMDAGNLDKVGGKGANLGEMSRVDFPVPNGFAVTVKAYQKLMKKAGLWDSIKSFLDSASSNDFVESEKSSKAIRDLIKQAKVPTEIEKEVRAAYRKLSDEGNGEALVAVRSSATAEDLPEASFAGQQDTYLGIQGEEELLKAVSACWASLWTQRAIAYRERQGFPHDEVFLSVLVQRMVASETAGVLFTANPLTGNSDQMLINASYGLGESVVSGRVTPDIFCLERGTELVVGEKTLGAKESKIELLENGGTETLESSSKEREQFCLSDDKVKRLGQLGLQVEAHYQSPQDIEWAFVGEDLFLLQTRPITSLGEFSKALQVPRRERSLSKIELTILDDILEHFPEAPSPLDHAPMTNIWQQLCNMAKPFGVNMPLAQDTIQINEDGISTINPVSPKISWRILLLPFTLWKRFSIKPSTWKEEKSTFFKKRIDTLSNTKVKQLDEKGLAGFIQLSTQLASDYSTERFSNYILQMGFRGAFLKILVKLARGPKLFDPADFLASLNYKTAEIYQEMITLAMEAEKTEAVRKVFLEFPFEQILENLKTIEQAAPFLLKYDIFIEKYGARTMKVYLPFSNRSWKEEPSALFSTMAVLLRAGSLEAEKEKQQKANERYQQLKENLAKRLFRPLRNLFLSILENYREGHVVREATLFGIEEAFVQARRATDEVARRFVTSSELEKESDIRYLTLSELDNILRSESHGIEIPTLIKQRKKVRSIATVAWWDRPAKKNQNKEGVLSGLAGSPGKAVGRVCLIDGPAQFAKLEKGDVLVCSFTDPAWTPLFSMISAVIADTGGPLSHAAIVAREYEIPAVLGTQLGTSLLKDGMLVEVDGHSGSVRILEETSSREP